MNYKPDNATVAGSDISRIKTVCRLIESLNKKKIQYCHWKSNATLKESLDGKSDLDLLICRSNAAAFNALMNQLGFKEADAPSQLSIPGIKHLYCYDIDSDKFIHVHAHFNLIIGSDWTKNYHIPVENNLLGDITLEHSVRIPVPEWEFIMLVIRMILKFSVSSHIMFKEPVLSKRAENEFLYLKSRADRTRISYLLMTHISFIDLELFDYCIAALQSNAILRLLKARRKLHKKLAAGSRHSRLSDICLFHYRQYTTILAKRIFNSSYRKRLHTGGLMIALVGGDGSGKSTAVEGLYNWLSQKFDVLQIHMGKPPKSLLTYSFYLLTQGASVLKNFYRRKGKENHSSKQSASDTAQANNDSGTLRSLTIHGLARLILNVLTARDRYKIYVKARRFASNGGIVICDRYPLPQIKLMDQPINILRIKNIRSGRLIKLLSNIGTKYQRYILPPELLFILKIEPELAVKRKFNEIPSFVRMRSREIWELNTDDINARVIDAGRSKEQVLSHLKREIWQYL